MATKTYIYKPATINGQPANGATRVIVRDAKTGAKISDTGYITSSGSPASGSSPQRVAMNQRSGSQPIATQPNWNQVSVGQIKAAGYNNLSEYKAAYSKGIAPDPKVVKPIQTFSTGTYNPNTGAFIDKEGRAYSTTNPAQLDAQIKSGPAIKTAGLDTTKVSNAPTPSIVAAVATKTVIDENSTIEDVVRAGNEAVVAAQEAKRLGLIKPSSTERTGYDFGTYQTPGGVVSFGPLDQLFGEKVPIAVDRKTGQTYKLVQTGDLTDPFARNTIGLTPEEEASISNKIYGIPIKTGQTWFNKGYDVVGDPIELGVNTPVSTKEKEALAQFQQNVNISDASFKFAAGITLGGGGAVKQVGGQVASQTAASAGSGGILQTIKPYLISAGLYAGGTQAPELARQVSLQSNRENLKDVDVGSDKFNKVIQKTFEETNQDYFGGTQYEIDEQGNILKKDTVKGKAGSLQKFVSGAFPAAKANPYDIYDDDFKSNLKEQYKKQYGKNLTETETQAIMDVYLYSAGIGTAVGQISQEVASEYAFRNLAKSTVPKAMKGTTPGTLKTGARLGGILAVESAPFGFLEGATGQITQSSFEMQEQDPTKIATSGLSGALTSSTFNFVGGGLTGRFGSKGGKLTQLAGWAIDPPGEIIGDKIVDVGTKGGLKVAIPGVATTAVNTGTTTTSTKTSTKSNTKADELKTKLGGMSMVDLGNYNLTSSESATMNSALQSQLNQDVKNAQKAKADAQERKAIKTAEDQFSTWIKTGQITIEPTVGVNSATNTDTRGQGQGQSNTNTNNDTTNNTNNNTNNDTTNNTNNDTTNIFNEENVNNETNTEVNVNVNNETTTSAVNVPIITPATGDGFPFFFPFGSDSNASGARKKKLLYYNELEKATAFYSGLQYGGKLPKGGRK